MLLSAILVLSLTQLSGDWQSFTNTNYVNDLTGNGSVLYLATNGGLQCFTAADTLFGDIYTNTEGLPVNALRCCAQERSGRVWIGTDGGGLLIFDPATRQFRVYQADALPLRINCLALAGDTVLVGTDNGLFLIGTQGTSDDFADDVLVQLQSPDILSNTVLSAGVSRTHFWVGTNRGVDRLERRLDSIAVSPYPRPHGDSVKTILEFHDSVFIATEWGIARYRETGFEPVVTFAQSHSVRRLVVFRDCLYVALETGLWRCSGGTIEPVWPGDCRSALALSDLWLGFGGWNVNYGEGLGRLSADSAQHRFLNRRLVGNDVKCAVTDSGGEIYAGHGSGSYLSHRRLDGSWEWLKDTANNAVLLVCDRRNRVWIGHWTFPGGGVSCFDPTAGGWQLFQWGQADFRNVVAGLGIDRQDTKWVFTQTGELIAIDSAGGQEFFAVPGVVAPAGGGYDFAFDARNRTWFGTMNGLAMLDARGTLHDQSDDSTAFYVTGTNVQSVALAPDGRIWIATTQGAAVLDNGLFRFYTTANSRILSDNVIRVRVDSWGNIWFLTDKGLSLFDPRAGHWSQPDNNRGLIPNPSERTGYYAWLELTESRRTVLTCTQGGLSRFQFVVPAESSLSSVSLSPNPFVRGRHENVVFSRLPPEATIQILTLAGERVAELEVNETYHRAAWRPKALASGLYLAVVRAAGLRTVLRLAVVNN